MASRNFLVKVVVSLLVGSTWATPSGMHGYGTIHPSRHASCTAAMDGQLPSFVPSNFHFSGNVRRYYVAAEEVEWDYAPTEWDNWLGVPMVVSPRANSAGSNAFGTKWLKALYRGYTNESFIQYTEQPPWQGTQGPTLRAEVGDLIEIMFVNKMTTSYATMHSMGLEYTKYSEGGDYPNNTMPGVSNQLPPTGAVPPVQAGIEPSGCVVYKWMVNDAAGPDANEPARTHSYHSYVSLEQDTNGGLIGPTIIYASGQMAKVMAAYREIPLLYMIYTESRSILSGANAAILGGNSSQNEGYGGGGYWGQSGAHGRVNAPAAMQSASAAAAVSNVPTASTALGVNNTTTSLPAAETSGISSASLPPGNYSIYHPQITNLENSNHFPSAPSFFTMNGYIFANNPIFEMCLDDNVIWYVNAYGSASHVFHMHGNGFTYRGDSDYAISINDGVGKTLVMDAVGRGLWQVICHVSNHQEAGMVANYRVYGAGECPAGL